LACRKRARRARKCRERGRKHRSPKVLRASLCAQGFPPPYKPFRLLKSNSLQALPARGTWRAKRALTSQPAIAGLAPHAPAEGVANPRAPAASRENCTMTKRSAATASFSDKAKEAAARGRSIQATIDRAEVRRKKQKSDTAMQAGQRQYPSKFPAQHLTR
jgi:hypothetical protein